MSLLPEIPDELRDQIAFRAKRELRKRMRAVRAALPAAAIAERSGAIVDRVCALDAWAKARTVALFSSMADEVQCSSLVSRAKEQGKRVVLPVVVDEEPGLLFRVSVDGERVFPMAMSAFGIDEPTDSAPAAAFDELDLVIVPALALDDRGHRIGYGRGYYDRTLVRCARARRVAVAFDFQLIAEVPTRTGDVPVHEVVTDKRHFVTASGDSQ